MERLVVLRDVCEDGEPVRHLVLHHVLRVQQRRDAQVLLRHAEGKGVVLQHVLLLQGGELAGGRGGGGAEMGEFEGELDYYSVIQRTRDSHSIA